jgi:hypothetical protein
MKACSYCGKEYSDDAIFCDIDQAQLVHLQPKPRPPIDSKLASEKQPQPITIWRLLSTGGFAVLSGFFGFGLIWLAIAITGNIRFKTFDEKIVFASKCMPVMIAGGIIGFIIGFVIALKVVRADPKTEAEIETKYVGPIGRLKIFFGFPIFFIWVFWHFCADLFFRKFGNSAGAYVALGICLVILALGWSLHDRIPPRLTIPIGVIGWLLTLSMIVWFTLLKPGLF